MATEQQIAHVLAWQRLPSGEFSIAVAIQTLNGVVPLDVFVLTTEEEGKLRAELNKLHVAIKVPGLKVV